MRSNILMVLLPHGELNVQLAPFVVKHGQIFVSAVPLGIFRVHVKEFYDNAQEIQFCPYCLFFPFGLVNKQCCLTWPSMSYSLVLGLGFGPYP